MSNKKKLKILMVAPEVVPFAKVGGLGDVVGALAEELARLGHDVRVVCPKYGSIERTEDWLSLDLPLVVKLGKERKESCRVWQTQFQNSEAVAYFLEYEKYFDRPEIYSGPWGAHEDNDERFAFMSRAAIDLCYHLQWIPDAIHCHDWTAGLVPVYIKTTEAGKALGKVATVFTIHNLEHQGICGQEILDFAGLPETAFQSDCLEAMGQVNMMKGGILSATKLTTVSPNYAHEIQGPELGCGLNHVLRHRSGDLLGILNGIDKALWDPQTDEFLPKNFSAKDLSGKAACKTALQKRLGLDESDEVPVFGAVARLYHQKGLDLLVDILPKLLAETSMQLVLLGQGEDWLEDKYKELAVQFPSRVGVETGYDSDLAHLIYAGADFFVMPSRFEPCGLSQLYAMAYGTPPIVRATGGLVDTVAQYVPGHSWGSGFIFDEATADGLYGAMLWAYKTYCEDPEAYKKLQFSAMQKDFSWVQSAKAYETLYRSAAEAAIEQGADTQKT